MWMRWFLHTRKGVESTKDIPVHSASRQNLTNIPISSITSDLIVVAQYEKKEPTALDAAEGTDSRAAASAPRKFFRNGTLLIERNGKTYTAQGVEL